MRTAWLVAANRGDVRWAGGEADHQIHLRTHETVIGSCYGVRPYNFCLLNADNKK